MDRDEMIGADRRRSDRRLAPGFSLPSRDLDELLEPIGCTLFTRERTLVQYVAWSVQYGLFELLAERETATVEEVSHGTLLTVSGADSLLGVLCALGLARRSADARYALTQVARDYLLAPSPFFVGDQFELVGLPMPRPYLRQRADLLTRIKLRVLSLHPRIRYGTRTRIENQHARNLAACARAVRTGEFAAVKCLVDIAGGSGAFAIPLALEYPRLRIVLTDLPRAVPNVRPLLDAHGLGSRVELIGLDAFEFPWRIPECDGIFIGNFLHGFDDETCVRLCRESYERLSESGTLWAHEMVWNEGRDGPLTTALWNAAMRSGGPGRQRTAQELCGLLQRAGFANTRVVQTASAFALVSGRKQLAVASRRRA